jgi:DNA-directed RNA polymerase subunit M/transcription elongation factor TFIIS
MSQILINTLPLSFKPFYTDPEYNHIRRLKLLMFGDAIQEDPVLKTEMTYQKKISLICEIEKQCYLEANCKSDQYNIRCDWSVLQFENMYHSVCANILALIHPNQPTYSRHVVDMILETKDVGEIVRKPVKELCPEKFEPIINMIDKRSSVEVTVKYTEMYFCRKCKHNKATAQRVQSRCLDEGNNFYVTCLNCDNRWFTM